MSEVFEVHLLCQAHNSPLADHHGQQRMIHSMRLDYYWPHVDNDVYGTGNDCRRCAKQEAKMKRQLHLNLFSPTGLLSFIALRILGLLPRTRSGNHYFVIIANRYIKPARVFPTSDTSTSYVATILIDNWIVPFGISFFL